MLLCGSDEVYSVVMEGVLSYAFLLSESGWSLQALTGLSRSGSLNHTLGHVAEVVSPDSPAFQEIRRLQAERFARACVPGPNRYLETVDFNPQRTIPLAIRRLGDGLLVGTVRLELPGASLIEAIVRFAPDSLSARILARKTFSEIGGFATRFDLDWYEKLDIIDTIVSTIIPLAKSRGIEWFWLLPRRTFISLLLAEIPGLLPPYQPTLCHDVLGWREESASLQRMRILRMKELPIAPETLPLVYHMTPAAWAANLAQRLTLLDQRRQASDLPRLLQMALRPAYQQVSTQYRQLNREKARGNQP